MFAPLVLLASVAAAPSRWPSRQHGGARRCSRAPGGPRLCRGARRGGRRGQRAARRAARLPVPVRRSPSRRASCSRSPASCSPPTWRHRRGPAARRPQRCEEAASTRRAAWAGGVSAGLERRAAAINARLAAAEEGRRRLLKDSLAAADAERRRLSERLHDEPLQVLMAAGQDIQEAAAGDQGGGGAGAARSWTRAWAFSRCGRGPAPARPGARRPAAGGRRRGGPCPTARRLRGPRGRRPGGRRVARRAGRRPRPRARHQRRQAAGARVVAVRVRLARDGRELLVDVADDGCGIPPERPAAAWPTGTSGWPRHASASRRRAGASTCAPRPTQARASRSTSRSRRQRQRRPGRGRPGARTRGALPPPDRRAIRGRAPRDP